MKLKNTLVKKHYSAAENFILDKIEQELPSCFTYHNIQHTLDVLDAAMRIAAMEKLDKEKFRVLRIAVCFHDAGCVYRYLGHEQRGCEMAQEYLPVFGFSPIEIKLINNMIMATKIPQTPKNKLENIITDADLDYLGREDYYLIAATLFEEAKLFLGVKNEIEWNIMQLNFLRNHQYHTNYMKKLRDPEKNKRIKEIEMLLHSKC